MKPPGIARLIMKVWTHPANQGRRGRQLLQAVRFQLRGRLFNKPTMVRLGDRSSILASLDSSASIVVAYGNPPDHPEWLVWRRFLRRGDLFVDVGANIGTYSVLAAEHGAQVIAVEPNAAGRARLSANLQRNGLDAELWDVVLTDEPKDVRFSSSLDTENHIVADTSLDGDVIRGETFDRLIAGRHVKGMKIDVEGAESQVLSGAKEALSKGEIDLLQIEWNHCAGQYFQESRDVAAQMLARAGYGLYRPDAEGRLMPSLGEEGRDIFAARPDVAASLTA